MTSNAARVDDQHHCGHGKGPIDSGSRNVTVNKKKMARAGDHAVCSGGGDYLTTGSKTVTVNSKPAARIGSFSMHNGAVDQGSPNVVIGGPNAGTTLGNVEAGKAACEAISRTRVTPGPLQSVENCGLESLRLLAHQVTGSTISEQALLNDATSVFHRYADGYPYAGLFGAGDPNALGNMTDAQVLTGVQRNGVAASLQPQTRDGVLQAVADGRGVITTNQADILWNAPANGAHAIVPTGLEYDGRGILVGVHAVDSGNGGSCDRSYAPDKRLGWDGTVGRFFDSLYPKNLMVVTDQKIW